MKWKLLRQHGNPLNWDPIDLAAIRFFADLTGTGLIVALVFINYLCA